MKKIINSFLYNFLILFFIYLFIFSTNNSYANTYKIENIEISDEYNANFKKEDVIDKAFQKAFQNIYILVILELSIRKKKFKIFYYSRNKPIFNFKKNKLQFMLFT